MGRFELLFILFLEILSFENIKMMHDEFLYDESLNSYHSHIYMLVRLGKLPLIFTVCKH
jgi:hypothetical protein